MWRPTERRRNLGDPIEIEGLKSAFFNSKKSGSPYDDGHRCAVGSVKTNIGHLEAASGISGLIKSVLSIKNKRIPAHINYSSLNRNIFIDGTPFEVPTETSEWYPKGADGEPILRAAGISSFGFGGVNSHVIIQEVSEGASNEREAISQPEYIFLLSAKTPVALKLYVEKYINHLQETALEIREIDLQYVLITGREFFGYRLAIVFRNFKDLENKLCNYLLDSRQALAYYSRDFFYGHADLDDKRNPCCVDDGALTSILEFAISNRDMATLAQFWILGVPINWALLYNIGTTPTRISLPTYPFSEDRFWLVDNSLAIAPLKNKDVGEIFELTWDAAPEPALVDSVSPGTCVLVIPDSHGYYLKLAKAATSRGAKAVTLSISNDSNAASSQSRCDTIRDRLIEQLSYLRRRDDVTNVKIVDLLPLDIARTEHFEIETISNNVDILINNALSLISVIEEHRAGFDITLSVLCHGAQGIQNASPELSYAPLWGLCKTAVLEHPKTFGRIIDIDDLNSDVTANKVTSEILSAHGEYELAYRKDTRYVRRLHETSLDSEEVRLDKEGTYLITGGLGSLGLMVAEWLAEKEVKRILLVSRHGLPADSDDEFIVNKLKRLEALKQRSVDVVVLLADVVKLEELETVCTPYIESGELKGIFHLAGTYTRHNINQMNLDDFNQVTAAKIIGTLNLQHLVQNYKLDQFVLFSSAAAVWGAATGAHYGAGNSFLDSFAEYFSSTSTVVKSIDWGGMWDGSGIIPDEHMANFLAVGIKMTAPTTGLKQLGAIMRQNRVNTVVAPVDWKRFIPVMSAYRPNNLFEFINATLDKQGGPQKSGLFTLAGDLSPDEKLARVEKLVESLVKETLGIGEGDAIPHEKGFYELGLDSLTSIDLKNKLDKSFDFTISTTDLFDFSTIQSLSAFLMEKLDISRSGPDAGVAPAGTADGYEEALGSSAELENSEDDGEGYSELTDMGEVQLLEALEAELESLGQ